MHNKILRTKIYKGTSTVKLLDEFESFNENGEKSYDILELKDLICIKYRKNLYWVSILIQRLPSGTEYIDSRLTFTDIKKGILDHLFDLNGKNINALIHEIFEGIKFVWNHIEEDHSYRFPIPVLFHAQNSKNRSGYGNRYCGEELVYEGTPYGETTGYCIVGAKYRRW